ncbi:MAG: hypothetical protein AAGI71_03915 [Bacteroidota bacterium]
MVILRTSLILIPLVVTACFMPSSDPIVVTRHPLLLGEDTVYVAVHEGPQEGPRYVAMHDNEDTGVAAVRQVLAERGGRFVELQHTGARNVTFQLAGQGYTFDPNRMFTEAGIRATLAREGAVTEAAVDEVQAFAERLLAFYALDEADVLIAIHNNTEGRYGVGSYQPGGSEAPNAARVAAPDSLELDDFFFITDASLFEPMRDAGFNVVLQDNDAVTDDGSLSVYCGQQGIDYVNVEAQHGHVEEQVVMIRWLAEQLAARGAVDVR